MNYIYEYNAKIQNDEIRTSNKVKLAYSLLVRDLENGEKYVFNEQKANKAITFVEKYCRHSKGKFANQLLELELWEKAFISAIFGVVDKNTNKRRFTEAVLIVGKKNGKSFLASAISLYMLIADGEHGAECYCSATKREQAKIVFSECERMVKKSATLSRYVKSRINCLKFDLTESVLKPLSSDSNTEDGLNISYSNCDEIHAWKDTALYFIIADGVSAREEPLILLTSTAGFIREGLYDFKYSEIERVLNGISENEKLFAVVYELDSRSEWTDKENWIKANPNLGVSKKVEYLEGKVKDAKNDPILLKNVLTKEFNIRETSTEVWMNFEDIKNESKFNIDELRPRYVIGGSDLSKTTDLTSSCVLFTIPNSPIIYVETMYFMPSTLLERHVKEDRIPYDVWLKQGWLRLSEGNNVDYDDVVNWYKEVIDRTGACLYDHGFDSWSSTSFVKDMNFNFGAVNNPVIQGKKTLSNPMRLLGADLRSKLVNYNNNPITRWCLMNVRADVDKNDNIQPAKTSNAKQRIDGFASMLNAYVRYTENKQEYLNLINRK